MLPVPQALYARYVAHLNMRGITAAHYVEYKKWLRYFLDFRDKYPVPDSNAEQVRLFCEKLHEKKQSEGQRQRAAHAVSLYFEMSRHEGPENIAGADSAGGGVGSVAEPTVNESAERWLSSSDPAIPEPRHIPASRSPSGYTEAGYQEKSDSPEWDELLATLAAEIKVRHYSRKTLKTYANWSRQFQRFLKNKSPRELSTVDVKEYLTYLAVKCRVAASTQNQAFNSLLFLKAGY
jgi:hypothetical protein